jgi:hypothetical protein
MVVRAIDELKVVTSKVDFTPWTGLKRKWAVLRTLCGRIFPKFMERASVRNVVARKIADRFIVWVA